MDKNIDIIDIMQMGRKNKHRVDMGYQTYCPVCSTPLTNTNAQYAHFMSQGKQSRKENGDKYVDHTFNGAYVCSLKCNNAIQIDRQPELKKYLISEIDSNILRSK